MIPSHLADCVEFTPHRMPDIEPVPQAWIDAVRRERPLKGRSLDKRDKYRIPRKPGDTVDIYPDDAERSDEE